MASSRIVCISFTRFEVKTAHKLCHYRQPHRQQPNLFQCLVFFTRSVQTYPHHLNSQLIFLSVSLTLRSSSGLDTSKFTFQDCYGLEPEVLSWARQPVKAVLMLFPITEGYEKHRHEVDAEIEENGVEGVEDVIYFKQTIGNACGTMALLHALGNQGEDFPLGITLSTDLNLNLP